MAANNKLDRFAALLNDEPGERSKRIYTAVIFSIALHIFVLLIMIFVSLDPSKLAEQEVPVFKEIDLSFVELMEQPATPGDMPANMSEDVRNLLANENSQRTSARVNYSGKSRAAMEQEVEDYYRNLEKGEYEKLAEKHDEIKLPTNPDDVKKQDKKREDYSYMKDGGDKSYSGNVAATFSLGDRQPSLSPKPTYRCKAAGKVVVKIEVSVAGEVTSASVDEVQSVLNECLREESVNYALKWKFNYKADAPKKQPGTITFVFSAQ